MRNGGGGDCPENNLEATIEGIRQCPDCEGVVMIADNFATPRDMALVNQIKQPIKIILCGSQGGINTKYLDLALATNGSIHTMEEDITDLKTLNEKGSIKIGKKKYILLIIGTNKDSNKDGKMNGDDLTSLFIYNIAEDSITEYGFEDKGLEDYYMTVNSSDMILRYTKDLDKNGIADSYQEPRILKSLNLKTGKMIDFLDAEQLKEIQDLID